jgi:hypothetical protein
VGAGPEQVIRQACPAIGQLDFWTDVIRHEQLVLVSVDVHLRDAADALQDRFGMRPATTKGTFRISPAELFRAKSCARLNGPRMKLPTGQNARPIPTRTGEIWGIPAQLGGRVGGSLKLRTLINIYNHAPRGIAWQRVWVWHRTFSTSDEPTGAQSAA